jgi:hypothetical protein
VLALLVAAVTIATFVRGFDLPRASRKIRTTLKALSLEKPSQMAMFFFRAGVSRLTIFISPTRCRMLHSSGFL